MVTFSRKQNWDELNQLQSLQRPASFGVAVGEVEGGLSRFDDFAGEVSADGDAGDVEGDGASSKCSEIHRQVRIQIFTIHQDSLLTEKVPKKFRPGGK